MKYIDAERLRMELEKRLKNVRDYMNGAGMKYKGPKYFKAQGRESAYDALLNTIDSLQQEQPEVDLEKEIETYFKGWYMDETDQGYILHTPDDHAGLMSVKQIARHFYEFSRQANPEVFDTVAFQKGVQEGRRLEREDAKSIIQSRIDEILGDAQPNPILRMELQELIKKIEA